MATGGASTAGPPSTALPRYTVDTERPVAESGPITSTRALLLMCADTTPAGRAAKYARIASCPATVLPSGLIHSASAVNNPTNASMSLVSVAWQ
ncbi:MAG TPA: hypothetical protein VE733_14695 [Streptosporangiaceae bacterium]|jgi:hypothetical protein|nr:hypothetical protein [Streptosporangiaceae bacterium]